MAVVSLVESGLPESEAGPMGRTYRRFFHAILDDSKQDGPVSVRQKLFDEFGITYGVAYEYGGEFDTAYCNNITTNKGTEEDYGSYDIVVSYGQPQGEDPLSVASPSYDPVQLELDFIEYERPVDVDVEGNQIVNSAGDSYDPTVAADDARMVLTFTRNEATADYALYNTIKNRVNSTTFLGFRARCVKAKPPRVRRLWHNDTGYYFQITYQFEVRDEDYEDEDGNYLGQGWDYVSLDSGLRQKVGTNLETILVNNQPTQKPYPLDGAGAKLADITGTKSYRVYKLYREYDFNELGLA